MKIPDAVRKTVAFLGIINQQSREFRPFGSVFFLGPDSTDGSGKAARVFAVTARHVIDGLRSKGCESTIVRLNATTGKGFIERSIPIDRWQCHPTDQSIDVAITEFGIPTTADHLVIPYSLCANTEAFAKHEVDLGDEVFVSGLFVHHFGKGRNIPIVRIGNIAALREERVTTAKFGAVDAYLIEARSIGGLSGSPVFVNLGSVRLVKGAQVVGGGPQILFLGLIHGHYDVDASTHDASVEEDGYVEAAVNGGIAIVVPYESIRATIAAYKPYVPFSGINYANIPDPNPSVVATVTGLDSQE